MNVPLGLILRIHSVSDRRSSVSAHITLHTLNKIPFPSLKKSRPLCKTMHHILKRRQFIKTYKNVLFIKWTVAAEVCKETYS